MRLPRFATLLLLLGCGRTDPLRGAPPGATSPPDGGPTTCAPGGSLLGQVCSTDQVTFLSGATVVLDALDCNGQKVELTTTTGSDGNFRLDDIPPGTWTVTVSLGAFSNTATLTIDSGVPSFLFDGICLAQGGVKIAVVTGSGDRIENLLDQLQLQYTLVHGANSFWLSEAAPFFGDLLRLEQFDLIFVDCAAAHGTAGEIDFGPDAAKIEANLAAFVAHGGSLYTSDWALVFSQYAAPGSFTWSLQSPATPANPFDTGQLMGFAPQTLTADVVDPKLATYLGKSSLTVVFPNSPGAATNHWGLLQSVDDGEVLVQADAVQWCSDATCSKSGGTRDAVPLVVTRKVLPANVRGGNVVYTSFHNVAQPGDDVATLLKFLVLNL